VSGHRLLALTFLRLSASFRAIGRPDLKWLVVSTSPSWISARPGYLARPAICGKAVDLSVGIHGASPGLHRIAYTASCGLGWRRPVGRLHPGQAEVSAAGSNHCHIVADVTSFAERTIVVVP
jgi:hypothetical protein